MTPPLRPRIFWFELANRWAIRVPQLADQHKAKLFASALRQGCGAVFHHGAQAWMVAEDALDEAKKIVEQHYTHVEFVERSRAETPPPPPSPEAEAFEIFCSLVGWNGPGRPSLARARLLYRRTAARLHPDAGGSSDQMASLNAAWFAIKNALA